MMKLNLKFILSAIFLFVLINPTMVMAQAKSSAIDVPKYEGVESSVQDFLCTPSEGAADGKELEKCINKLYRFGIAFGGIALVFFIVFAGYMYITGGESGKSKAKTIIQNALAGIALLLGSYVILNFINPSLTIIKPIQPPIFDAADIPSCDEVGIGERCVIASTGGIGIGGGGKCSSPIADSSLTGTYNNSLHNRPLHGPVRSGANSPPPEGIVDLGAKGGSPVYSPITGKVVLITVLSARLGSYASIISDPNGGSHDCVKSNDCANLAHVDFSVKEGQMVTAGQQVGVITAYSCGGSAGCMGPHLHLELKLGGKWITGDGFKGTWTNMKAACGAAGGNGGGGGGSVAGEPAGLTDAKKIVTELVIDMQYASANPSSNNFMKQALYTGTFAKYGQSCYLLDSVAQKLKKAQEELTKQKPGYKLKAWDCYRPVEIQKQMRDWGDRQTPPYGKDKIASPGGGNHPKGLAIDLTIVDAQGKNLAMPTIFDDFNNSNKSNTNSQLLLSVMNKGGFSKASTEWWHFH